MFQSRNPIPISFVLLLVQQVAGQCWENVTCNGPLSAAYPGLWDESIYAPPNRTMSPPTVLSWPNLDASSFTGNTTLAGNGSLVTFDFGIEVGGIASLSFTSSGTGSLGIAFTEAKNYVGEWSDSSNGKFVGPDGALYADLSTSPWTMPSSKLRGGFRYMTVFLMTNDSACVVLKKASVTLDFQPTWPNLRAYQGYFSSDDELLNRIWYAGAYTLQSNLVPVDTGRQVPMVGIGWDNNATLGPGNTIIVDGAKRDRAVWPGDMGVAIPSTFVSLGDLESVKNALQVMFDYQNNVTGAFPEAGPPLLQLGSDTYQMWTMIGTYNYVLYTNDTQFLNLNWDRYLLAMKYITEKVNGSGLLNVTGIRDWARWQQGFHNTEANTILYHTLQTGVILAEWATFSNDSAISNSWISLAQSLASAINAACFDQNFGAYRDNDTATTLHPQDANSLSLLFGVAPSASIPNITSRLMENWTPIGPETPELPNNISPFITSLELPGRFKVRDTERAFTLLRTTWGWIMNNKNSTESTLIEGYLTNGSFGYRNGRGYNYDTSYVSHAHGWSTGPTSALTNYVVGLEVTGVAGSQWSLAPQMGDLDSVQGGFVTSLGKFWAAWENKTTMAGSMLSGNWSTPAGTSGILTVPGVDRDLNSSRVVVNGRDISVRGVSRTVSAFGEHLLSFEVDGGNGTLEISY